jgi:hypothetical protein
LEHITNEHQKSIILSEVSLGYDINEEAPVSLNSITKLLEMEQSFELTSESMLSGSELWGVGRSAKQSGSCGRNSM